MIDDSLTEASTTTGITPSTSTTSDPTTTVEVTTTIPEAPTTSLPPFPPARETLEHGGDAWSLILAVSDVPSDPILTTAALAAQDAGYPSGVGDAGCDQGSLAALGIGEDGSFSIVSVYLESEEDAIAARDAFFARGIGAKVVLVQTYCLD